MKPTICPSQDKRLTYIQLIILIRKVWTLKIKNWKDNALAKMSINTYKYLWFLIDLIKIFRIINTFVSKNVVNKDAACLYTWITSFNYSRSRRSYKRNLRHPLPWAISTVIRDRGTLLSLCGRKAVSGDYIEDGTPDCRACSSDRRRSWLPSD